MADAAACPACRPSRTSAFGTTTGRSLPVFLSLPCRTTELVCGIDEFRSAEDINHFLGELYKLLASNKISPRRGAVMAYTCSLLLRTLLVIDRELQADNDSEPQIIIDMPRPKRDWPEGSERAFYEHMSSRTVPNNGDTPSSANTKESP